MRQPSTPSRASPSTSTTGHPGSSLSEIKNEPDWTAQPGHHRLGLRNSCGRYAGQTHIGDEPGESPAGVNEAREEVRVLKEKVGRGELVSWRGVIEDEADREAFHLKHPSKRPPGWRYVPAFTEDWVKEGQEWPANVERRKREEEERKNKEEQEKQQKQNESKDDNDDEEKKEQEEPENQQEAQDQEEEDSNGLDKFTPTEMALLRAIQHEKDHMNNLQQNNGQGTSPVSNNIPTSIDTADQFTPDNWIPRSPSLIRLTGKLPLNAEPPLSALHNAGLITPNELHYVRSHGPVPKLVWEFHEIEIDGRVNLSMRELANNFEPINIPILLACDNGRRKELNMRKQTTGFNWGPGGVGCAYWKGPLLRNVLLAAGIPERMPDSGNKRYWIHFEGADEPSEGKYATSIPLAHVMDPFNDVILAYEMNDLPLPPDHGYPVRVMIPGYVGGRCVKWLKKIWISDKENDSHYHRYDNRMLPGFVTDMSSEFAKILLEHPDTACYEQIVNSVIARPAQGERIPLSQIRKGRSYRVAGFAYSGSGHPVRRVEVSLDGGKNWLYAIRRLPDRPVRHDDKFWTWVHWHIDIELILLAQAESITVRATDSAENTQPQDLRWNISGTMNNCWYTVKSSMNYRKDTKSGDVHLLFRHPVEPANGNEGWMKPSAENQIKAAAQEASAPEKQFTREEIEKHNTKEDCWIVVNGKVYDATSVLSWHPGGPGPILAHAGRVHHETTEEYSSIHDDYATSKLQECILGTVTEKAMKYIQKNAEEVAKEREQAPGIQGQALEKHRWVAVKLVDRKPISPDTREYTFQLPEGKPVLGIGACQHIEMAFHMRDKMVIRPYTPTLPLLPRLNSQSESNADEEDNLSSYRDGKGSFMLTVKTYFPDETQPGGALSNILDCLPIGEEVDIRGPTGDITYEGDGYFTVSGDKIQYKRVSLVLGGTGITPGYALIARIMLNKDDKTEIRVIDANKTPDDILLRDELDKFERESNGQLKIAHVISSPGYDWKGLKGHVNKEIIREHLSEPADENVVILCGPPVMIEKAVLPALDDWGYVRDENMLGL
ncbi:nitrate reductase [Aspergillus stella-maris]|uniref:nitrate reductase n=1 Tax=Aspergillus stella-maris TaxID=1810926 RepID=UPI003CCD313F